MPASAALDRMTSPGWVLSGVAVLMPPLAIFAPKGLALLLGLVASLVLLTGRKPSTAWFRLVPTFVGLTAALVVWGFLSTVWSITPEHSLSMALRVGGINGSGLLLLGAARSLGDRDRDMITRAMIAGVAIALLLLLEERFSSGMLTSLIAHSRGGTSIPLTRFDRGTVVLSLAVWPALGSPQSAARRLALIGVAVTTVMLMASQAAMLAVLAGLASFCIALHRPRLVAAALGAGTIVLAAALPIAAPDLQTTVAIHQNVPWLKTSGIHRLAIWRFTADRIAERPILGWGMDASRELPGGHFDIGSELPATGLNPGAEALPLHPHNALLQWRVELGIPGTTLCLAIFGWVLLTIVSSLSSIDRASALAFVTGALIIGLLSYGAWQEWWLSCLWLLAALHRAMIRTNEAE
jgi:O-antigen ligase